MNTKELITYVLLVCFIGTYGCSTSKEQIKVKTNTPELQLEKANTPPKAKGYNKKVPPSDSEKDKQAMEELELEEPGLYLSNERAQYFGELKLYAENLYSIHQFNINSMESWKNNMLEIHKYTLKELKREKMEDNTWWNQNKDSVMLFSGFTLGSLLTTFIVFGVNQASNR